MIYEIYYPDVNMKQEKILISHTDYLKFKVLPEDSKKIIQEKEKLEKITTKGLEWFTDKSPLYEAISTGILNCNGIYKCLIKPI